jgi:SOS-response transcriptional repressor LexA
MNMHDKEAYLRGLRERIRKLCERAGGRGLGELARRLDVDPRTLRAFLNGRDVRFSSVAAIMAWLEQEGQASLKGSFALEPALASKTAEEHLGLPVYGTLAAGGPIDPHTDVVGEIVVPVSLVKDGIYAMAVRGASMEPTLVDGSVVGIDTKRGFLEHERLFAFWLQMKGSVIKRCILLEGGTLLLQSDNERYPSFAFPLFGASQEGPIVIGKIVWSFQRYR